MRLLFLLLIGVLLWSSPALAQHKDDLPSERDAAEASAQLDKAMRRFESDQQRGAHKSNLVRNLSFRNFVRGGVMTGNLLQAPYVNNANISAGYWGSSVSLSRITWPKGSGVEYGHTMSFIVAGQVFDANGDTLRIISESYNRSGGDAHPSGSHKYQFMPLPGYYNMTGDPSTRNQLNNNPDDRETLNLAGFYYVGGLNEDANGNGVLEPEEDLNNNGELDRELVNLTEYPAQSNLAETWPAFWPPASYPGDQRAPCAFEEGTTCAPEPGVRAGRWNGAYGAFVRADQEAFYLADDRDNDEFPYYPFLNPATGQPDMRPWEQGGRRGLGVEVDVRQYQWSSVLAEDILISTFDVKNVSEHDIPSAIIAMIVDYDIAGQTGNNRALFDTSDDITYQWLKRDLVVNGFRVGYAGVGFLESPGIDDDGRDNDSDGMVDESRDNGIDDDGDWRPWTDVNGNGIADNEDLNNNFILDPGEDTDVDGSLTIEPLNDDVGSDGLGPENEDYPGPDPDGTEANGRPDRGEPNFEFTDNDEIDQIGLTNMVIRTPSDFDRDIDEDQLFWREYIQPVPETDFITPDETADVIYVYASGFTEIRRGQAQRFSLAFFCGNDFQDMLRNKRTMQNIYDADYNFAEAPRRPFLTAVPGDGKVTLVWDASAEQSRDPIYGFDFEMYKIYRSTDPEFNEIKTITDAFGNPLLWEPLQSATGDKVQFDLKDGLTGAHPVPLGDFGISYDMGTDSGLRYSYVDSTVDIGRTYYYAVVSVDQGYHASFYERGISEYEALAEITPTESSKVIEVDALDHPTNVDRNTAVVVPQRAALGYEAPYVEGGVEQMSGNATGSVKVDFLIPDEANALGYRYAFTFTDDGSFAELDSTLLRGGLTTGFTLRNLTTGETLAVSEPGRRGADLFSSPSLLARVYDGMKFSLNGPTEPSVAEAKWLDNPVSGRGSTPQARINVTAPGDNVAVPNDYELYITEIGADSSNSLSPRNRIPVNFQIEDVSNLDLTFPVPFQLTEPEDPLVPGDTVAGQLSPGDVVNLRVFGVDVGGYQYYARSTWRLAVELSPNAQTTLENASTYANALYDSLATYSVRGMQRRLYGQDLTRSNLQPFFEELDGWYSTTLDSLVTLGGLRDLINGKPDPASYLATFASIRDTEIPKSGDTFRLLTNKPFDRYDVLEFTVQGGEMTGDVSEDALDDIYVVPDPYVAVNTLESRNILLSGRGERRIDFRNLPQRCTIRIFTASGRLVRIIEHDAPQDRSLESWNLRSEDGLDVAYGVYIYHVDAPGIGEKIGRFAIIK